MSLLNEFNVTVGRALVLTAALLTACDKPAESFKAGTTMGELKAQSAAIARKQEAAEAAVAAKDTRTALSLAAAKVTLGTRRADVIALLGHLRTLLRQAS